MSTRRGVLIAGAAGIAGSLAGCLGRLGGSDRRSLQFEAVQFSGGPVLWDGLFDPSRRAHYLTVFDDPSDERVRVDTATLADERVRSFVVDTPFEVWSLAILQVSGVSQATRLVVEGVDEIDETDVELLVRSEAGDSESTEGTDSSVTGPVVATLFVRIDRPPAEPPRRVSATVSDDSGATTVVELNGEIDRNVDITYRFDDGITGWTVGADSPESTVPGTVPATQTVVTPRVEGTGDGVRLIPDVGSTDGAVWLVRELPVSPGTTYDCTVSVTAYRAEAGSATLSLLGHLGPRPPRALRSFPAPGRNSTGKDQWTTGGLHEGLPVGTTESTFEWTSPSTNQLFLAVGVRAGRHDPGSAILEAVTVSLRAR
ncbi:hypothetical protein [Haloarchaeobius sp. TZWWS8]|uniref:hypothetical protein n=1 Tax=Haloarchaeobius sp. TZWWS8 TaxID=3446121 RepID=UPI003EBB006F